jgi:hypothetical protein
MSSTMNIERVLEVAVFVAVVGAFFLFGTTAAVRTIGAVTLASGVFTIRARRLGISIGGRPPSFYLRGGWAVVIGIAIAILGCVLVWFAPETVCLMSKGEECAT